MKKFFNVLLILFLMIFILSTALTSADVTAVENNYHQEDVVLEIPSISFFQTEQAEKINDNKVYLQMIEEYNFNVKVYRLKVIFDYQFSIFFKSDFDNYFY